MYLQITLKRNIFYVHVKLGNKVVYVLQLCTVKRSLFFFFFLNAGKQHFLNSECRWMSIVITILQNILCADMMFRRHMMIVKKKRKVAIAHF